MAKAFSEHERKYIETAMIEAGSALIRKKGLRQVTIEDITTAVDIAKGSFYAFYDSREELLWDVIKHEENVLIEQMKVVASSGLEKRELIRKILLELYLADDGIVNHLKQADVDYIVRKLPPEIVQADLKRGEEIVQTILLLCGETPTPEKIELSLLMIHSLQLIFSSELIQKSSYMKKMLDIMVDTFINALGISPQ